jgi:hypothetical protein
MLLEVVALNIIKPKNIERAIRNGQSRETANIGFSRRAG